MRRLIIDTDVGSDDALAMIMALRDPDVKVEAIITVSGNVDVEMATINAFITLDFANTYRPPVYIGMERPLCTEARRAFGVHGKDGLGDVGYPDPHGVPEKEHGVDAMLRIIEENPGELELVTLGPLTNLAMAILRAPETIKKLQRITVMGASYPETGPYFTPFAEANINSDVEAANVTLRCGVPLAFVPINACRGSTFIIESEIEEIKNSGPMGKFCVDCNQTLIDLNLKRFGRSVIDPADPVAMAVALCPECVAESIDAYVVFEQKGEYTRGVTVFDHRGVTGNPPNCTIVTKIDEATFKNYTFPLLMG